MQAKDKYPNSARLAGPRRIQAYESHVRLSQNKAFSRVKPRQNGEQFLPRSMSMLGLT